MTTNIQQSSYAEKLAILTIVYLELSLSLPAALAAAQADLGQLL